MMPAVFLSASGGLDSTTLLAVLLNQGHQVQPVFFDYGSTHNPHELEALHMVCNVYGLNPVVRNIAGLIDGGDSALLAKNSREIPSGEAGYKEPGSLAATVVPGRNLIMASVLAAMAEAEASRTGRVTHVALGIHASDHDLYPDCRPEFIEAMGKAIARGTEGRVTVFTPFLHLSKAEIIGHGLKLKVPFELTRSCYKAQSQACGVCGTCRERKDAFARAGAVDPVSYGHL